VKGPTRISSARLSSPSRPLTSTFASSLFSEDKPLSNVTTGDFEVLWIPIPAVAAAASPIEIFLSSPTKVTPSSPSTSENNGAEAESPAKEAKDGLVSSGVVARLGPNDVANADQSVQRKAMALCMKYLSKAAKDYKLQVTLARNAFGVMAWDIMAAYAKLSSKGIGVRLCGASFETFSIYGC
jgi:hypothetical protein